MLECAVLYGIAASRPGEAWRVFDICNSSARRGPYYCSKNTHKVRYLRGGSICTCPSVGRCPGCIPNSGRFCCSPNDASQHHRQLWSCRVDQTCCLRASTSWASSLPTCVPMVGPIATRDHECYPQIPCKTIVTIRVVA